MSVGISTYNDEIINNKNNGTFTNTSNGSYNRGAIYNKGTYNNEGTLYNELGTFENEGTINNYGQINGEIGGTIQDYSGTYTGFG